MPFLILLVFLAWPLVEIASIIEVGRWIGTFPTLLLLVIQFFLGLQLIRSQSILLHGRLMEAMRRGAPPEKPLLDGGVVSLAGLLLMIPGFVSDIVALIVLIPFTRGLIWQGMSYWVRSRYRRRESPKERPGDRPKTFRQDDVIDAEYTEVPRDARDHPEKGERNSPWAHPR